MREISKMFYMLFLVLAVLAFPVSAQPATTVSIGDASAMPGSSVTMPIMVNDVTNLGLGRINVTYNPSVVHVAAVASGTGNALTVTSYTINNSIGFVEILAHDPRTPHNGSVIFANVTYKAEDTEGSLSPLNITARLRDWNYPYPDIQRTITNGTFTVTLSGEPASTPTPTPSNGGGSGSRGSSGYVPSTTPRPSPTEKPPAVEEVAATPSPTPPLTITPPATPAQTPAPTIPAAQVPVMRWFMIMIAIFVSVIIVLTGYLLIRKMS